MDDLDDTPETGAPQVGRERERLGLPRSEDEPVEGARAAGAAREADEEARMRQALNLFGQRSTGGGEGHTPERRGYGGHGGGHAGHGSHMQIGARRHRFVQDGQVPVSVVRGRRDHQAADLAPAFPRNAERSDDVTVERSRAEQAERKLAEREAQLRSLQTRLGHAELERDEAVAAARALREELAARPAARASRSAVPAAEAPEAQPAQDTLLPLDETGSRRALPRRRRETEADLDEPEPIKWWL